MIELLMVILLVGVLAGTALPQFLDFRREGREAAAAQYINNIRSSLKMSLAKARVSCNKTTYPPGGAISTNSLLFDNYCLATELPNHEDRLLTNGSEPPLNPDTNLNTIVEVACPNICVCAAAPAGYYYNQTTGDFGYPGIGDCP